MGANRGQVSRYEYHVTFVILRYNGNLKIISLDTSEKLLKIVLIAWKQVNQVEINIHYESPLMLIAEVLTGLVSLP